MLICIHFEYDITLMWCVMTASVSEAALHRQDDATLRQQNNASFYRKERKVWLDQTICNVPKLKSINDYLYFSVYVGSFIHFHVLFLKAYVTHCLQGGYSEVKCAAWLLSYLISTFYFGRGGLKIIDGWNLREQGLKV